MSDANSPSTSPSTQTPDPTLPQKSYTPPQSPPNEVIVRVTDEDDDEELAEDDAPPRAFPFRSFGVFFLVVAIATAVILAAVPSAIEGKGHLTNSQNGYVPTIHLVPAIVCGILSFCILKGISV